MKNLLPVDHPWTWALAACAVAAALEGLLSGTGVKARLSELRLPRLALPLWAWSIVGLLYYLLFALILHSLLGRPATAGWTAAALGLVAVVLGANASWNWLFFRRRDLRLSLVLQVAYLVPAGGLAVALLRLRDPLAGWYLLYVGYLAYAMWWGFSVWRLNQSPDTAR
jgi:tryptophan-rich sensory protein